MYKLALVAAWVNLAAVPTPNEAELVASGHILILSDIIKIS